MLDSYESWGTLEESSILKESEREDVLVTTVDIEENGEIVHCKFLNMSGEHASRRALSGSCFCQRNKYKIHIPENAKEIPRVFFDNSYAHRGIPNLSSSNRTDSKQTGKSQGTPISAWIRVPLAWYESTTFSYFEDETHNNIRRTYSEPQDNATRQFCGFCGTPLSYYTEIPQTEAEYIALTLGSLSSSDLRDLEELGLLPTEVVEDAENDKEKMENVVAHARSNVLADPTNEGMPWFETMVEGSKLGKMRKSWGHRQAKDERGYVEWEILEWTEEDDAEPTTGKRKLDEIEGTDHSYQIEGAPEADGRGPSIWDEFCKIPGKIADGSSGDVACDSYNRTAEDIALLKLTGAKAYRFSVSWSRIIPLGGRNDPTNPKGIAFYKELVDDLLAEGITPFVTLFHWDLPDELDKRYGGLLNKEEFTQDFGHYSRVLFEALPKVKYWITFNEPWCSSILGYNTGLFAPGHTSDRSKSAIGDSSTECWIVGHNLLLAHGTAVKIYREEFKSKDKGEIGITLNGDAVYPWDPNDPLDVEAAERKLEFAISWFGDPIYLGHYPASMVKQLGSRLPTWTAEEIELVQGSNDFYGMNHYTANYIKHKTTPPPPEDFLGNLETLFVNKAGDVIGPETQSFWLRPHPPGYRDLLIWLSNRYNGPKFYCTENGTSLKGENDLPREEILDDEFRVEYFRGYINALADAVQEGVNVKGYMAWSLMDNFEWAEGYETRFGVTFVDYEGGQKRYPKKSALMIKDIFDGLVKKE
ncbi:hypothetical protein B7494_g5801 [Chlorociboria aeruginascens]|nr:hypothetical protein B7494_g5801 [Chlorociboria aeruginascens]